MTRTSLCGKEEGVGDEKEQSSVDWKRNKGGGGLKCILASLVGRRGSEETTPAINNPELDLRVLAAMKSKIIYPGWNVEIKGTGHDSYLLAETEGSLIRGDGHITLCPDQRSSSQAESLRFYDFKVGCSYDSLLGAMQSEELDKKIWFLLEKVFDPLGFKPMRDRDRTYGEDTQLNQFAPLYPLGFYSLSDLMGELRYFHIRVDRTTLLTNLGVSFPTSK